MTIEGRLPGLNDLISSRGRPWWACQKTKDNAMELVMWEFKRFKVPAFKVPIILKIAWIEKNRRRDRDNVSSGGSKIILDAMKHLGIIIDDSRRWVHDIQNGTTQIDKVRPRIEIWIEEVL